MIYVIEMSLLLTGGPFKLMDASCCLTGGVVEAVGEETKDDSQVVKKCENSAVFASLPLAIKWLRDSVQQNKSVRLQVKT